MNGYGSQQINLNNNCGNAPQWRGQPAWSPDGNKIAFVLGESLLPGGESLLPGGICVMNADGSNLTQIVQDVFVNGEDRIKTATFSYYPTWTHDGTKIVYTFFTAKWREPFVEALEDRCVSSMNADGSGSTPLTSIAEASGKPKFSPDGSKIVYVSGPRGHWVSPPLDYPVDETEIYVMNADGSGKTRLTNNSAEDDSPCWGLAVGTVSTPPAPESTTKPPPLSENSR